VHTVRDEVAERDTTTGRDKIIFWRPCDLLEYNGGYHVTTDFDTKDRWMDEWMDGWMEMKSLGGAERHTKKKRKPCIDVPFSQTV
jgi:hypothetical protein